MGHTFRGSLVTLHACAGGQKESYANICLILYKFWFLETAVNWFNWLAQTSAESCGKLGANGICCVTRLCMQKGILFTSSSSFQALYPMVQHLNSKSCCEVLKINWYRECLNMFVTLLIFWLRASFETFEVELLMWHAKMLDWKWQFAWRSTRCTMHAQ